MYETDTFPGVSRLAGPAVLFGALRSGTTLFRIMLKEHPGLHCPGETDFLFDHIAPDPGHPTGWRYDLEALRRDRIFRDRGLSLPEGLSGRDLLEAMLAELAARAMARLVLVVHRNAPKIAALCPEAHYLHLLRDPRDVALSSLGMGWAGISYFGVDNWIATERGWDVAQIAEGQVLTVSFEELMRDIEGTLHRVCGFLGLSYTPAMLDYSRNSTYAPPDPRIAEGWRRKAHAREIALLEGKLGPLLETRGYRPAGAPRLPGPTERQQLRVENALRRWHFNIRRFGLPLFLGAHAARLLRIASLRDHLSRRQEAVILKTLK